MNVEVRRLSETQDVVSAILAFVENDNEVLRSLALRALAAVARKDPRLRATLTGALLDPDPDVRSDAMELFAEAAEPEDGAAILRSLEGDPVREVKLAAIRALVRLNMIDSIPLLRALVIDRCDDRVAWEDELGDWEDWLDIQIAAIEALGDLNDAEAIDAMTTALNDEFGQTLDIPVFAAFCKLGEAGVSRLVAHLDDGGTLQRQRAAAELARADTDTLARHVDTLLASPEPGLRKAAIQALPSDDARCAEMARSDIDPAVRREALLCAADEHDGLARACLSDEAEAVQAAALTCLSDAERAALADDLVSNLHVWMANARAELASAAARELAMLAPAGAATPLHALARDTERPLDARVTAVHALATLPQISAIDALENLLADSAQQVRTAALNGLRRFADDGDGPALQLFARAIDGTLLSPDAATVEMRAEDGPEIAMPKGENTGARRIRISPDGDIIETNDDAEDPATARGQSTLDAIQSADRDTHEDDLAEDTPEEAPGKRRRRRAVEGPDAIANDLSMVAITIGGDLESGLIEEALAARLEDKDETVRATAWAALAKRKSGLVDPQLRDQARAALTDPASIVRLAALTLLDTGGDIEPAIIDGALADPDGPVRAWAVGHVAPEQAVPFVCDRNSMVRAAAAAYLSTANADMFDRAIEEAIGAERTDALEALLKARPNCLPALAMALEAEDLTERKAHIILDALSRS